MNKKAKTIISILTLTLLLNQVVTASADTTITTRRLFGSGRIETALAIAKDYNSGSLQNVILATGADFPDALTGSVLAAKLNAPILLVGNDAEKNALVLAHITQNLSKGGNIYILGGVGVVSKTIEDTLKSSGYNVSRLGGNNREDTAKLIDNTINVAKGTPVIVATENDFPDALSVSSIAGINQYPILISGKDSLPQATKDVLANIMPSKVYIIGGIGVLTDNVKAEVQAVTSLDSSNLTRIAGSNRYETSLNIAKTFNLSTSNAVIATGGDFPDALAGSILATKLKAPIILADNDITAQKKYLNDAKITNITLLGGLGAISTDIENQLKGITTTPSNNIPPVQTPVNSQYLPGLPTSQPSLDYMKSISVEAIADYTTSGTVTGALSAREIPFDGKWYHWKVSATLFSGKQDVTEYFQKVLKIETAADGKITRYVYDIEFHNGVGFYPPNGAYDTVPMNYTM